MKIIDRYISIELAAPFLMGIVGFMLMLVTDLLFTYVNLIINKGIPLPVILKLLIFKLPFIIVLTFPVSTVFATSMLLGRMSHDNEVVALRTSGITLQRIVMPILLIALCVSLCSYLINEQVVPWTNHISENIIRQMILKEPLPQIRENVLFNDASNRYFYVKKVDKASNTMNDIMIYETGGNDFPRVITAKRARYAGTVWQLEDGIIYRFNTEGEMEYQAKFGNMEVLVNENIVNFTEQKTTYEINSRELGQLIEMLDRGKVNTAALKVDFLMKFAVPMSCFIFALIGIPFSLHGVRSGRTWGLLFTIILMFTFYVFASVFRALGHRGIISPLVAAWFPNFFFGTIGTILLIGKTRSN